jgi:hypothetical protein
LLFLAKASACSALAVKNCCFSSVSIRPPPWSARPYTKWGHCDREIAWIAIVRDAWANQLYVTRNFIACVPEARVLRRLPDNTGFPAPDFFCWPVATLPRPMSSSPPPPR